MLVDKKPLIYIWRPIYRSLRRVRGFFVAESQAQLQQITAQLSALERQLTTFESRQRAQWTAFEQLYFCFLSDPDRNTRSQLEQFLEAERRHQSLRTDFAEHRDALDEQSQSGFEQSVSSDAPKAALLDTLAALDRNYRILASRFENLASENRRRWESLERLLSALATPPDPRPGASAAGSEKPRQTSAGGGAPHS